MFIGENSGSYESHQVFLNNLALFLPALINEPTCFLSLIEKELEANFKAKLYPDLLGTKPSHASEIGIKLLIKDQEVLILMNARLARMLITKKLATSLIDHSHGELFSSTENGIFSFIVAEFLWKLKRFNNHWPELKLLGVFSSPKFDDSMTMMHLALSLDGHSFAVRVSPFEAFSIKKPRFLPKDYWARAGHLSAPLTFSLKNLKLDLAMLDQLSFGDLIMFDSCKVALGHGLYGAIAGHWHDLMLCGSLKLKGDRYQFLLSQLEALEEYKMETVQVEDFSKKSTQEKVIRLTENIRIALSIELSRIPFTLKELANLKEGEIIDLKRNISDPLELVIEGKVIGYCQPVEIDGRLGVRILEMNQE